MCDPVSLAVGGLAASALSTGVGIAGALKQGQSQAAAARYDAQVKGQNAALALQQGEASAFQTGMQGSEKLGLQRATLGASGVDVNSGSALLDQLATAQNTGIDEGTTKYNAAVQAEGFRDQAGLDTSQASSDASASYLNAGATFLGGASQFASKWSSWQQQPAPSDSWSTGSVTPINGAQILTSNSFPSVSSGG